MSSESEGAYILGVDPAELQRLWSQHGAWAEQMRALLTSAGLRPGMKVLDLGCGPGTTSFELARFVNPGGQVFACDESPACIQSLVSKARELGVTSVDAQVRRVEELGLRDESLDAAYGRWILSWLPDVPCVFDQVSRALRPGGAYILQEYIDWSAMRLLPGTDVFKVVIDACMNSWSTGGGTINIAEEIPTLARQAGLEVESFTVNARTGRPHSAVWNWIGDFLTLYLARLVRQSALAPSDYAAFLAEWKEHSQRPDSIVIAPVVADVVLRKVDTARVTVSTA